MKSRHYKRQVRACPDRSRQMIDDIWLDSAKTWRASASPPDLPDATSARTFAGCPPRRRVDVVAVVRNRRQRCWPIKPLPPVIRTFNFRLRSVNAREIRSTRFLACRSARRPRHAVVIERDDLFRQPRQIGAAHEVAQHRSGAGRVDVRRARSSQPRRRGGRCENRC